MGFDYTTYAQDGLKIAGTLLTLTFRLRTLSDMQNVVSKGTRYILPESVFHHR